MFKEVLLSQVGAGITHISGYIEDLILEAGQGFFESKVEREKLQKLLTEYIERHEKYNEICTLAEEIDFEGLVIYIQSQMLEDFRNTIVQASRDMMERNENVNSIIMFHLALFVIRISKNNSSSLLDYNEMSIKIKEAIMVDEANE